jgi:hypothetical protein
MKIYYGNNNKFIDVTTQFINNFIKDNKVYIPQYTDFNSYFGDPLPDIPKKLIIQVNNRNIAINENDTLNQTIEFNIHTDISFSNNNNLVVLYGEKDNLNNVSEIFCKKFVKDNKVYIPKNTNLNEIFEIENYLNKDNYICQIKYKDNELLLKNSDLQNQSFEFLFEKEKIKGDSKDVIEKHFFKNINAVSLFNHNFAYTYHDEHCVIGYDKFTQPNIIKINDKFHKKDKYVTMIFKDIYHQNDGSNKSEFYLYYYSHFIELLIGAWLVHYYIYPNLKVKKLLVGNQPWCTTYHNGVQKYIMKYLYPDCEIIEGINKINYENNIVVSERAFVKTNINQPLEILIPIFRKKYIFNHFRDTIIKNIGFTINKRNTKKFIYIKRNPPRCLNKDQEQEIRDIFNKYSDYIELEEVDFAINSFEKQVEICTNSDGIIGVHGNGLTNIIWLPKNACVIEIFPYDSHHYNYQTLSEIAFLSYHGIEAKQNGYYIKENERHLPVYGHGDSNQKGIDYLNTNLIEKIIKDFVSVDN